MKAKHLAAIGLSSALILTACGSTLKDDEHAWCREHPQQVVAASYTVGGPMTMGQVLEQMEAERQSSRYVLACRFAYEHR